MIAAGLILPIRFPDPGKPEGIRTFRKPIMTLKDVSFKYPGSEKYIIEKVDATLTLGSRAVIVGGNGSGKSTFLKLLIGDLEAEEGDGRALEAPQPAPLLRGPAVAAPPRGATCNQTPIHYIQERFRAGPRQARSQAQDPRHHQGALTRAQTPTLNPSPNPDPITLTPTLTPTLTLTPTPTLTSTPTQPQP